MKKGFTLVELLASIVIIALISLIGVEGYRGIDKKVKEQQYKNKIVYIETQAALYAQETGYLNTTIENLIKLGYVKADNKNGDFLNPKNGKKLNDSVIAITKDGENYYGHFTSAKATDGNIEMTNENLNIKVESASGKRNEWYIDKTIVLKAVLTSKQYKESDIKKITWYNNGFEKISRDDKNEMNITIDNITILNTVYRVVIEFNDGNIFEAKEVVKVDTQDPKIYANDIVIEKENEWSNQSKNVKIIGTDQNGSGVLEIKIEEKDKFGNWGIKARCKSTEICNYKVNKNSTLRATITDNVGMSSNIIFEVDKIDTQPPKCNINLLGEQKNTNSEWYTGDVAINVDAYDEENGARVENRIKLVEYNDNSIIKERADGVKYINQDTNGTEIQVKVTDLAGNIGTCSTNIKRDTIKPTCVYNVNGIMYKTDIERKWFGKNGENINALLNGIDSGSGIQSGSLSRIINYDTAGQKLQTRIYDRAGNYNDCSIVVKRDSVPPTLSINAEKCLTDPNGLKYDCTKISDYTSDTWTNQFVNTYATISDNLSGVNGYSSKVKKENLNNSSILHTYETFGNSLLINEEGPFRISYMACDYAGNCSNYINSNIKVKIDRTPPICYKDDLNITWKTGTRTITYGCDDPFIGGGRNDVDGASGCNTSSRGFTCGDGESLRYRTDKELCIVTYGEPGKKIDIVNNQYTISDQAGNQTTCTEPFNVYIDNTKK